MKRPEISNSVVTKKGIILSSQEERPKSQPIINPKPQTEKVGWWRRTFPLLFSKKKVVEKKVEKPKIQVEEKWYMIFVECFAGPDPGLEIVVMVHVTIEEYGFLKNSGSPKVAICKGKDSKYYIAGSKYCDPAGTMYSGWIQDKQFR